MQLDALQSLALSVAAARSPDSVLREMVQGLGMWDGVALARVWLLHHPEQGVPYLELKASIGASRVDPSKRWNRTDGAHHEIPLSYGKVGQVAASNRAATPAARRAQLDLAARVGRRRGHRELCRAAAVLQRPGTGRRCVFQSTSLGEKRPGLATSLRGSRGRRDCQRARVRGNCTPQRKRRTRAGLPARGVRSALKQGEIIAESPAMRGVLAQVQAVAQSDSSVLILGESGVGKELIAAAVHDSSPRRDGPLVKVNCASVPRELFESEFFGHVRGAFSGASRDRQGRFLLADGGSLFLDEVGEIPLEHQSKLLRVLQERTFEPVGDDRTRRVDVRLIAATNRPLEVEVESGRFRRDLFYRLSVVPIVVPPLRERREDILPMARQFLLATSARLHLPLRSLSSADEAHLQAYDFPGNVRELQNLIERAWCWPRTKGQG